jgi:hypothetical protein
MSSYKFPYDLKVFIKNFSHVIFPKVFVGRRLIPDRNKSYLNPKQIENSFYQESV